MHTKKIFFLLLSALMFLIPGLSAQNPCNLVVEIATPDTLSCQNPTVLLQATVSPPGNYTYEWFGTGQVTNNPSLVVTQPGGYVLYVFDSLQNCWGGDTVFVVQDGTFPVVNIAVDGSDCDGTLTLSADIAGTGPFTYSWMTGETTPTVEVQASGGNVVTYCVTVTDTQSGCSGADCIVVTLPAPLTVSINYFDSGYCFDSLGMFAVAQGGAVPYSFLWNNGSTSSFIPDPAAGTYVVTVTDANGCTAAVSYVVEDEPGECAHLEGYVLADWNTNCTKESSDSGLSSIIIRITDAAGNDYYANTDNLGFYRVDLSPGTYTVEPIAPNNLWDPCPASVTLSLQSDQTTTQDFLLAPLANCPAMTVDLAIPFLRRCFQGNGYVYYCNRGTEDAANAYVEIEMDPFLQLTGASLPFTSLGNNLYRFDLGTVPFNTCGSFSLNFLVSCDATLGQTHCSEAVIYPTGSCEPGSPLWSGASLQVEVDCGTDSLDFIIQNTGTGAMSAPLEYVIIEDAVMLMQAPPPTIVLAASEEYHIKVPANGSTWRVEVKQEPFHPGNSQPSAAQEGCTTGTQFSTGFINQFSLNDNDPWIDIECRANVGSYDPNDKQGLPLGYAGAHYIKPGTDLEYLIRFQNTGTDTAFTVVIRDELSPWLDAGSVEPGASSHPYTFEFYGDRKIKFTFDNILLPDSSVNLEGSQGFVSFKVAQIADVPLQTDIPNTAAIFFDFNEPIYTNTTVHRVAEDFVTVSAWQPFLSGLDLRVMPNPVGESAVLELRGQEEFPEWQVELRDALGRPVRTATVNGAQWNFQRDNLPAGLYLVQVRAGGRVLGAGKLMLK